jgi:hypothetical protein
MSDHIEKQFNRRMLGIYERAKAEADYNATYFLRMLSEEGGLETARRLVSSSQPSDGFTQLYLKGRLDLTVEHLVLEDDFRGLFAAGLLEMAADRLRQYGGGSLSGRE